MFFHFLEGEMLLIKKPYKWTSFDVVGKIRVMLKYRMGIKKIKVGHAGTLDPLATGLLIVFTGKSTKKIDEVQGLTKVYTGTFTLGATTPSFDLESAPENQMSLEGISNESIIAASKKFIGEIQQVPPIFSALKIDGKKAYDMAREGTEFEMEARTVHIYDFKITDIQLPEVSFEVECSKGTYIRSLAHDFGKALGCGAYLSSLCRIRIGDFSLDDAITLEQLEALVVLEKEKEQQG